MKKMRCSMRESHLLQPAFFTSTPISKRRKISVFNHFENSPIIRPNFDLMPVPKQLIKYQNQKSEQITVFKVLGDEKIPLIKEKRCSKKSTLSHPPLVVISDSEEEKSDIYSERTLAPNSNFSTRNMNQRKENAKRVKRRNTVKSLKENLLETESKKSQKRISRVDTIIDEIMKERKSTVLSPSPLAKMKSEYSVDALVDEQGKNDLEIRRVTRSSVLLSQDFRGPKENKQRHAYVPNILGAEGVTQTKSVVEVAGKLQDIGNFGDLKNIGRTRKRAQSVIKKEKDTQYHEEKKISNCEDFISNNQNDKPNVTSNMSKVKPFNENLPVIYNLEEINANEWIQVNGQNGVFVKKNFRMDSISNGFVKIEAKCSLQLHSVKSQIFSVAEGRGIFVYDNENIKVKLGPGQTVTIPAGFPCKIINTGLKKNLVFTYVKLYETERKH